MFPGGSPGEVWSVTVKVFFETSAFILPVEVFSVMMSTEANEPPFVKVLASAGLVSF